MDSVVFAAEVLLPLLRITKRQERIALHPTCASQKMNHLPYLQAVAKACADSVVIPISAGCCGMAGDRGMLFPELTASATREEAEQMRNEHCSGHYSSARTCELALTEATGRSYHSILHLLDRATE
jgi:D-lactate dehydrogenase